ncbi:MAG TPA: hypothetical protein VFQ91_27415, partial [Bryobacteraceae bacterium]|nr:hypothetical protein [Bryobacteraceae bacterium]
MFDIRGLGRIFGAPEQIAAAIQQRAGIAANLALAANPDAAIYAAIGLPGLTIIAPGKEKDSLARLPVHLLDGSLEFAHHLALWGIRTFGELAALPPLGIAARFGEEGVRLQQLASGTSQRRLRPHVDPLLFREELELEHPVDLMEPLLFLLSRLLRNLCERLRFQGQATNEVRLQLQLEQTADYAVTLNLPLPMLNATVLLKLLQLELNERPPGAPVEKLFLELMPAAPRAVQHGLYMPLAPEPEKLEVTLARIRGLVGSVNVGTPKILDTHRADAFCLQALFRSSGPSPPIHPRLAFRRFRPPCPARVWCTPQGTPSRVVSSAGSGVVTACAGPWHSAGDWWTQESWDRQEWDIEIADLGIFRLLL